MTRSESKVPSQLSLRELAAMVGSALPAGADGERRIAGIASLTEAAAGDLSYLSAENFVDQFKKTRAAAVLVHKKIKITAAEHTVVIPVDDAELAVARVLEHFSQPVPRPAPGVDSAARVDPSASLGEGVRVGPFATIGAGATLGRGCIVHPHVFISDDVTLGEDCELFPNVTLRERITIGSRVIIHSGSVIGTDGFGYRWDGSKHVKVPQIGTVIIEDDVEIGSCVCIDRAKFAATRIGRGTKIDNLVQIAHNCVIGPNCIIVGQAGLAGSAVLGNGVVLGGQVAIRDHITLGDGAVVAACGAVAEDVPSRTIVSGMPALPHRQTLREQAALRRLPDLVVQVRKLQEELNQLRKSADDGLPDA